MEGENSGDVRCVDPECAREVVDLALDAAGVECGSGGGGVSVRRHEVEVGNPIVEVDEPGDVVEGPPGQPSFDEPAGMRASSGQPAGGILLRIGPAVRIRS